MKIDDSHRSALFYIVEALDWQYAGAIPPCAAVVTIGSYGIMNIVSEYRR